MLGTLFFSNYLWRNTLRAWRLKRNLRHEALWGKRNGKRRDMEYLCWCWCRRETRQTYKQSKLLLEAHLLFTIPPIKMRLNKHWTRFARWIYNSLSLGWELRWLPLHLFFFQTSSISVSFSSTIPGSQLGWAQPGERWDQLVLHSLRNMSAMAHRWHLLLVLCVHSWKTNESTVNIQKEKKKMMGIRCQVWLA